MMVSVHFNRYVLLLFLVILVQELGPEGEDSHGAEGRGDEDGEDSQSEDLRPHALPLRPAVLHHVVQEDGAEGGLHRGLGHPGEGHEDLLLCVESAAGDSEVGADHPAGEGAEEHEDAEPDLGGVDLVHLDLGADQGKDDGLEDDPHLGEGVGDGVVVSPAFPPPLHGGDKGEDDGGKATGTVVVDEVGAVQGYQATAEQDQPPGRRIGVGRGGGWHICTAMLGLEDDTKKSWTLPTPSHRKNAQWGLSLAGIH